MQTAFADTASALLDEDPLTAVVLAEISADMFGKAAARHPDRVLNVGIREQLMVSVGGGLALAGMRPIVHTYAPFLVERAYEQVKLGAVDGLGSGSAYLRLSSGSNGEARPVSASLQAVRSGRRAVVVAVGPMLSPVLDGVADLDVTVAYATTVRPFDAGGLRALEASSGAVVLVEPYLAGTSAFAVSAALASRPHRLLSLGVGRGELRRYGTPADHAALHGLDAAGIRRSVIRFLGLT